MIRGGTHREGTRHDEDKPPHLEPRLGAHHPPLVDFHGDYQPWEAHPVAEFLTDEPNNHYDVVKQEADKAMEDAASPGAADLPSEY
jgi:hypothetical protein